MSDPATGLARSLRWWHLAFAGVPLAAFALTMAQESAPERRLAAGVLLALVPLCWLAFGRLSFARPRVGAAFAAVLILLAAAVIAIQPNAALLQSLVYPFVWVRSESTRAAVAWNAAVAVGVFAGLVVAYDGSVFAPAAITALSLAFSLAFGLWITRIAEWGEERARLLDELTAAQDRLAAANREQGTAAERERIARELHDTLAQSLTGLVITAQRASSPARTPQQLREDLALIESIARDALTEARAVVAANASVAVDGGLADAADRLAARFERETGIAVSAHVQARVPRELEVVLLRCAQEALANIRKHSGARAASLTIEEAPDGVVLTVEDDGRGLAAGMPESSPGFGIAGMRERLELVGGDVAVAPREGGGTRLTVRAPIAGEGRRTA
ncbi:sensor histidine kinase [Naasia sp. SYSU D00948]|uniref:sensor histidine kinase n=1 Tax=Naasia sp. SYSU D00948 TaxID=2817379 RepID=UPI001B308E76|nr:sensor histidine kinase [Naasia sp. SYSU D00948]